VFFYFTTCFSHLGHHQVNHFTFTPENARIYLILNKATQNHQGTLDMEVAVSPQHAGNHLPDYHARTSIKNLKLKKEENILILMVKIKSSYKKVISTSQIF
jgi:hypothetical protein